MKKTLLHAGKAALGVLLALVAAEIVLQVGALLVDRGPRGASGGDGATNTVLCHGDSNVFGLLVGADQAYPAQLQRLLDRAEPGRHRVVNKASPGWDTARVLADLPAVLDAERPSLLLLTVGANNQWAWTGGDGQAAPPWYESLRLVRVARWAFSREVVAADRRRAELAETGDVTKTEAEWQTTDAMKASIQRDLRSIREAAKRAGTRLVLVGYAAEGSVYRDANLVMRALAKDDAFELVDTSRAVGKVARRLGFERVFYPDLHPRAVGYEVVARQVYNHLVSTGLSSGGIIDPVVDLEHAVEADAPQIAVIAAGEGDEAPWLEITGGKPDAPFRVVLWGAAKEKKGGLWPTFDPPNDALFQAMPAATGLAGTFDADGRARVPLGVLDDVIDGDLGGWSCWAVCMVEHFDALGRVEPPGAPTRIVVP